MQLRRPARPSTSNCCCFEAWLTERLDELADAEHDRLLRQFASWHSLPRLRGRSRPRRRHTHAGADTARHEFIHATGVLAWLARARATARTDCRQADLDALARSSDTDHTSAESSTVPALGRNRASTCRGCRIPHARTGQRHRSPSAPPGITCQPH